MTTTEDTAQDGTEIYRCRDCGRVSDSIGKIHAHIERHRGVEIGPILIQNPLTVGDHEALMERTETINLSKREAASDSAVFEHVECVDCGLVRAAEFVSDPAAPLPKQYCPRCDGDRGHNLVEIEVVSRD